MTNKRFLTHFALPLTATIVLLAGCKNQNTTEQDFDCERTEFVVDSLLRENRKLTDSLATVQERLDDCEAARTQRCPCKKKTTPAPKPTPKPAPKPTTKPTPKITVPPIKKPVVQEIVVTKPTTTTVTVEHSNNSNNTVVIGNNNTVNTVVINTTQQTVQETATQVKTTTFILSGHAQSTYTYTK